MQVVYDFVSISIFMYFHGFSHIFENRAFSDGKLPDVMQPTLKFEFLTVNVS